MWEIVLAVASMMVLVKSAEFFVGQATALAKKLKVNDFLIGLTVVAFGTSLPELISTIYSSASGHNQLVAANIIGSNITNLCLILGVAAIMYKYKIRKRDVDINIPLNLAAMMAFWGLAAFMGFELNWAAGISLLLVFVVLLILSNEYNYFDHRGRPVSNFKPLIMIISLGLLIFSGKLCINSIVSISVSLGISESILGYFLLALGTSLPELITTLVAVKNHDGEMGIGSILGSNLFNLLFVVGISTFIRPLVLIDFKNDLLFLTGATLAAFVFAVAGKRYSFDRREGWGLLVIYAVFMIFQVVKG